MLDDDDVERQLRLELDLVQRCEIGRIGDSDRQPVAALTKRHHSLGYNQLLVDDVTRQLLIIQRGQVQHRMTERFRREPGDGARAQPGDVRRADQFVDELRIGLGGLASEVLSAVRPQLALLDKRARPGLRSRE